MTNNWSLSTLVKDLICFNTMTPEPRERLWASDLGKMHIDTYLKLKGVPETNPTTGDGMFNMYMGKQIELGIIQMLKDCGVAHESQTRLEIKLDGCLPLTGKPDIVLEVKDWEEAIKNVKVENDDSNPERAESKKQKLIALMRDWQKRYPEGLPKTAFEIKSVSDWGYNNAKIIGWREAYHHYFLQTYTYLYGLDLPEVHLLFVSKGSKMMTEEIVILKNENDEAEWKKEIKELSDAFYSNTEPTPPPLMLKNGWGKDALNWNINWSNYRDYILEKYYPEYLQLLNTKNK